MTAVASYQQAVRQLIAARRRVRSVVKNAASVFDQLKGWEKADPSTVNGVLDRAVENWPAKDSLASVIDDWRKSSKTMLLAWEEVSPDDRICVVPPKSVVFDDEGED